MREFDVEKRADWLGLLALADAALLAELADANLRDETFEVLRGPETGLMMANARLDGGGNRFNLAEIPVSRCTVRSRHGTAGVAYRIGRCPRIVSQIARLDALLQLPSHHERLRREVLAPLLVQLRRTWQQESQDSASSRVRFDTLTPETLS
ncbi:MAG: phosphonate C-P lyase system protein PhnG [Burkholderiaceae bacterium]